MRDLNVFVSPSGNAFMRDIATWLVEAGNETGRTSTLVADGTPPHDAGATNLVVAPHEFYLLADYDDATIDHAARVSTPLCTEQPGTPWFDIGLITTRASQMALDINVHGVDALRTEGVDARHLRLGGVPSMAAGERPGRDIDLLFLGGKTDRRGARLAELAPVLWQHDVDLRLFDFQRPVQQGAAGLVFGADKYELLRRSHVLLNIHRDDRSPGYMEWARFVEAMANGCCIVTEPVAGSAPLSAGEHFVEADNLGAEIERLLADPSACRQVGEAARRAVMHDFPLAASLGPLLDEIDQATPVLRRSGRPPRYRRRMIVAQQQPLLPAFRPTGALRERTYRALMAETRLQRKIERARSLVVHGADDHIDETTSAAYDSAEPEVSVIVTLYNYEQVVGETLDSIAASTDIAFEIIVIDDHSTDDGRAFVRTFAEDRPDVALLLLGSDINRGLPAARNLAFSRARAELVMVMDADNMIYPNGLRRLADALYANPTAAFAYSSLEEFGVSAGIRSAMAWSVERLCDSNYIDAQAMIRKDAWARHGGYRTDDEFVFGWEDWELWLRFASAGEHGIHVSQMLGRYRTQEQSMISTTNLVSDLMLGHLRELHPTLPWAE